MGIYRITTKIAPGAFSGYLIQSESREDAKEFARIHLKQGHEIVEFREMEAADRKPSITVITLNQKNVTIEVLERSRR